MPSRTGIILTTVLLGTAGRSPRTELRVTSDQPDLEATWTEDDG